MKEAPSSPITEESRTVINEDVVTLTAGARTFAEEAAYEYAKIEKKHRFRMLFEPMRILRSADQIKDYTDGKNPYPKSVEIDPANTCNHDCPYCIYQSLHKAGHNERLSTQRLLELVEELGNLGCNSILFVGGGEPMTNRATPEAIELASNFGISAGLVTNGSLVSPNIGRMLKKTATYVRFSLDAHDAATHRDMHKRDDFETIITNLNALVEAPGTCTVGTGYFINEGNWQHVSSYASLMKDIGVDYVQFKSYSGIPIPKEWHNLALKELLKTFELSDGSFDVHVMERIFQNDVFQVRGYTACHWQAFKPVIGADGSVFLCAQKRTTPSAVIGNINNETFSEIWNGKKRQEVLASLNLHDCPFCVHDRQNKLLEYFVHDAKTHNAFF